MNLVVAVVLLRHGGRSWSTRLLALAMVGSAGAFNLQAHSAALAVQAATGIEIGEAHQILLHGVAGAAYAGALLLVPTETAGSALRRRVVPVVIGADAVRRGRRDRAAAPHRELRGVLRLRRAPARDRRDRARPCAADPPRRPGPAPGC